MRYHTPPGGGGWGGGFSPTRWAQANAIDRPTKRVVAPPRSYPPLLQRTRPQPDPSLQPDLLGAPAPPAQNRNIPRIVEKFDGGRRSPPLTLDAPWRPNPPRSGSGTSQPAKATSRSVLSPAPHGPAPIKLQSRSAIPTSPIILKAQPSSAGSPMAAASESCCRGRLTFFFQSRGGGWKVAGAQDRQTTPCGSWPRPARSEGWWCPHRFFCQRSRFEDALTRKRKRDRSSYFGKPKRAEAGDGTFQSPPPPRLNVEISGERERRPTFLDISWAAPGENCCPVACRRPLPRRRENKLVRKLRN